MQKPDFSGEWTLNVGESALSPVVAPVVQSGFVHIEHREPTIAVHLSITMDGKPFDTSLGKFGALLGDGSEIGCNAVLNPGSIIGRGAIIYPNVNWRGVQCEILFRFASAFDPINIFIHCLTEKHFHFFAQFRETSIALLQFLASFLVVT